MAVAEGGLRGEVRECGGIANTLAPLRRLARKLGQEGVELRFCYEGGPCGYGIQRRCCQVNLWRSEEPDAECAITLPTRHYAIRPPLRLEDPQR